MKKYIIIASILLVGCKADFGELNTPPDKVASPDPVRLFTDAIVRMEDGHYLEWFHNYSKYYLSWTQATVAVGGNRPEMNTVGDFFAPQNKLLLPKLQFEQIRYLLNRVYSVEQAAPYRYLEAACNPVQVYLGLHGTDMYGSMAYTEASTAPFTTPALTTPRYQTQQELFDVWLGELDQTINVLSNPVVIDSRKITQIAPASQDLFYSGNWLQWAKLANSLKLKIAVRMLNTNKPRALEIAEEVAANPAGVISSVDDDLIYFLGSEYYRTGNNIENLGSGSDNLISFLRSNQDPRLLYLFSKNDFNSSVVQAFFDSGQEVPSYILAMVNFTDDGSGNKSFVDWESPGEPWVRYHGAPIDIQSRNNATVSNDYFNVENFRVSVGDKTKTYQPLSLYNEEMVRGGATYTFPSPPAAATVQDNTARPWHGVLFSSAETNLYLAEMALLGASLPESADTYYHRGVELSVRLFDRLASLNKIPYYELHSGFDATDVPTKLTENQIAPLLARYALAGTTQQKLEQVYVQQYIHHLNLPQEQLVTVRRSGYPASSSLLLKRVPFNSADASYAIPRRLPVAALDPTDGMYSIKQKAYTAEGFTPGSNVPLLLQNERVAYDKNAPEYGAAGN